LEPVKLAAFGPFMAVSTGVAVITISNTPTSEAVRAASSFTMIEPSLSVA
jgi:hypothetical protein